jgi:hypothetical protein
MHFRHYPNIPGMTGVAGLDAGFWYICFSKTCICQLEKPGIAIKFMLGGSG